MEWLQSLLDNSTAPALIAFLLGLLTAISPCPLATNIAAIGYIGKEVEDRKTVFQERFAIYAWAHCRLYGIGMRVDYGSRRGGELVWHSKGNRNMGKCCCLRFYWSSDCLCCSETISICLSSDLGKQRRTGEAWQLGCFMARYVVCDGIFARQAVFSILAC